MNDIARPLVTIVIPTFNHAEYLDRALKSVLDQTYANWEAIVIDNHSTDNTDEVIAKFTDPRINCIKIYNKGVIAISRNAGISKAKGEWIAFLDSDDWWMKNKIELSLDVAVKECADLIFHDLFMAKNVKQKIYFKKTNGRAPDKSVFKYLLQNGNVIPNSSVLVRKSVLDKVGKLSTLEDKVSWEDFDCWLRISKITNQFYYINKPLGYLWLGGRNFTNPQRTASNCIAITKYYTNEYCEQPPFWLSYSYGTALMDQGFFCEAAAVLSNINLEGVSLLDVVKCKIKKLYAKLNR
jgi:glycosyltransferase involved in cell wall biosynthesis